MPQPPREASIDLDALAVNFAVARRCAAGRDVIAVLKADAYGHGAPAVARRLVAEGARHFAVVTVDEAAVLRDAGVEHPVLLLGGVHTPDEAVAALALGAVPVLHHDGMRDLVADAARARGVRAAVQVEVDTGMARMGIPADAAAPWIAAVAADPALALHGVYTHYACADDLDPARSRVQAERFAALLADLRAAGVDPGQAHAANSAALLAAGRANAAEREGGAGGPGVATAGGLGEALLAGTAVRPGLMLYGVPPAPHLADPELRPVMTLRVRVAACRRVRRGDSVGYGGTWRASDSGFVATLPIGYADGIPWAAANRGHVLVRGQRRPIVGRVSMDFIGVWLGDEVVPPGEEAIVFGAGQGEVLGVDEAAAAAGTLAYELLVRVGQRVPRTVAA